MISFAHDVHRDIVFEKLRSKNVSVHTKTKLKKPALSNSSGLKSVFEKLRFRVGLDVEIKLRLSQIQNQNGDCCVFKFLQRSVGGKHLLCFQSD